MYNPRYRGLFYRWCPMGPSGQPRIFFQLVPEQKAVKNRVHLDLSCDSAETEVERLTALGASLMAEYGDHLTFRDPEGNEFCLSRPVSAG